MSSWARVGAKCVCVDNTDHPELTVGAAYTIIGLSAGGLPAAGKYRHSSLLIEVKEARNWTAAEGFAVERFRPLITKTQEEDVAMFKSLVTGAPMEVEA